jgi:serine/threonine protein kinase
MSAFLKDERDAEYARGRTTYVRDNRRYQVLKCIARGIGMKLYKALDLHRDGRLVAIKRLQIPPYSGASSASFLQELHMVRLLNRQYPNLAVPSVLDWFGSERAWYLVFDFVNGQNLEQIRKRRGGTLPTGEVLSIGLALCSILGVLHTHEPPVVHRDIKPANILVRHDGQIFLSDFGTACLGGSAAEKLFRGTSVYAAPEQRLGGAVTTSADMYALGATFYELLTGCLPPQEPALLATHLSLRALPPRLRALLAQMLEQDPGNRPPNIERVRGTLLQGIAAVSPSLAEAKGAGYCSGDLLRVSV